MQTIVFIETNKSGSSREAIRAAERLGYLTVLFTTRKKFLSQRTEFPDVHQMYYVNEMDTEFLTQKINRLKRQGKEIVAVVSFIDPYVQVASGLSEYYGNRILDMKIIGKIEDKIQTRKTLQGQTFSPHFIVLDRKITNIDQKIQEVTSFPLIVKAPVSTGSKDVYYVENLEQLREAVQTVDKKYDNQPILIEEYLQGPQFLLEVFVQDRIPTIVAVIEQEITKLDRFIVTGYGLLAELENGMNLDLQELVETVVEAFNMNNGTFHIELKFVHGRWKLIEINPRISGGVMNRLIEVGYGINLVEETIRLYTGQRSNINKSHKRYCYAHYMIVNSKGQLKKVTGKQRALRHEGVEEIYIKPRKGAFLTPPLSMGHRYGYVLASADTLLEAKRIAQNAAKEIEFHLHQA